MEKFATIQVNATRRMEALLTDFEERKTKTNQPYVMLWLSDGSEIINANLWNTGIGEFTFKPFDILSVDIQKQQYGEGIAYVCKQARLAPPNLYKPEDFAIKAPLEPDYMYDGIMALLKKECPTDGLVQLVEKIYEANKERLLYWSAAKSVHHNCFGGLLYHTFRMLYTARYMASIYKVLDKELLYCAVALHDIGKLQELETNPIGVADYTVDGNLYGHLLMGVEMIDHEVWSNPGVYDEEKIRMLKHCIASHHGQTEFGAIKVPAIPEAQALYLIDMMDSRMYIFEHAYEEAEPGDVVDSTLYALKTKAYKATYRA